ncbi:MAG: D-alanyl-D-alanine carboxypeptidase/D-alanyl-D-alanine-endopeptidase [Phycicoccus sp.]
MHVSTRRSAAVVVQLTTAAGDPRWSPSDGQRPSGGQRRPAPHRRHRSASGSAARALGAAATTAALLAGLVAVAPPGAVASPARMPHAAPAAYTPTPADQRIVAALNARVTTARFGSSFSGAVVDSASDSVVWQRNGTTTRMPASTTKLVTAANALTVLGPDRRFRTTVRQGSTLDRVVLVGTGDPSLSTAQLEGMIRTIATLMVNRRASVPKVYVDDDAFPAPTLATGWKSSYVPDAVEPVRALVRDQRVGTDTSADVGRYVTARLHAHGLHGAVYYGRTNAAANAPVLAWSDGSTVASTVSRMLMYSDNEIAEALHKLVGIASGTGATWTGARTAQSRALARQGLTVGALYDGSGLSRSDRLSAVQLTRVVDRGLDTRNAALWPMRSASAVPTAGRTGTLGPSFGRFTTTPSSCAAGQAWAKTGRLSDVVSLAGWTVGTDGRVKVFAFVANGTSSTTTLKRNVDMLAATVKGCY